MISLLSTPQWIQMHVFGLLCQEGRRLEFHWEFLHRRSLKLVNMHNRNKNVP